MDKDKSIIEKFTETVKSLADSASEALKSEEPPKAEQSAAAYMPFAAEGLVTDPMMVPAAAQPVRRKRRAAKKSAPKKSARKAAKKSAAAKSRTSGRTSAKASAKKPARASAKRRAGTRTGVRKRGHR